GQARGQAPGVVLLQPADVGIVGPADDFAVAEGFKTFQDGPGYFHEGLSLQECVVPIVVVRAQRQASATPETAREWVQITYRSARFTSSVVGLKVTLTTMFPESLAVRLEAFDGSGPK